MQLCQKPTDFCIIRAASFLFSNSNLSKDDWAGVDSVNSFLINAFTSLAGILRIRSYRITSRFWKINDSIKIITFSFSSVFNFSIRWSFCRVILDKYWLSALKMVIILVKFSQLSSFFRQKTIWFQFSSPPSLNSLGRFVLHRGGLEWMRLPVVVMATRDHFSVLTEGIRTMNNSYVWKRGTQ